MDDCLSINLLMTKIKKCDCEAGTETVKRDTKNEPVPVQTVAIRVRRWLGFFAVTLLRYVLRVLLCPRRNRFSTPLLYYLPYW